LPGRTAALLLPTKVYRGRIRPSGGTYVPAVALDPSSVTLEVIRDLVSEAQEPTARAPLVTEEVTFLAGKNRLSGLLDVPADGDARGLVIFVHGYGPTNVVEQNWYAGLRHEFGKLGLSSFVWDKPGQGHSEGTFDQDRLVADSAEDVLAAAAYLPERQVPGSQRIGIWGISRAGWIAPLAMAADGNFAFWISVSGVDAQESFGYLLRANWEVKGYPTEKADRLLMQWKVMMRPVLEGRPYAEYLSITEELRADPFYIFMNGDRSTLTEEAYAEWVKAWQQDPPPFDLETGLRIYVEDFDETLGSLDMPVLALFGEKDRAVDWRSTKALYERTIGANPRADLTIHTFPDGNHNLHQAETGGFEETLEILNAPRPAEGYLATMFEWTDETLQDAP